MISSVYLLFIEIDWFYGDKQIVTEVFYNVEDAREYMDMYADSLINDIWQDHKEYYNGDTEKFYNDIEINKRSEDDIYIYLEDECCIDIDITKKDIMSLPEAVSE
jgi:hypothetical protein